MNTSQTVYPGMPANGSPFQPGNPANQHPMTQFPGGNDGAASGKETGKPIMGFLYSVSKTANGEYWPLYVGPNTIGRGGSCAIKLKEATVSENHATLVIRKMMNNGEKEGIFVFVQDTGSTVGTMLNGVTLNFSPKECKNGDIITIGANYELYLILVDPDAVGLAPKEDFKSVEVKSDINVPAWGATPPMGVNTGNQPKGTQPGAGSSPFDGRKPTIYMPKK